MKHVKTALGCFLLFCVSQHSMAQEDYATVPGFAKVKNDFIMQRTEMQIAATPSQLADLLQEIPHSGYFCFTEDRVRDIIRPDSLPQRWMSRPAEDRTRFAGECAPGEFYTWQLGVYSPVQSLEDVTVTFSDLKSKSGKPIKSVAQRCFNLGGIDKNGVPFTKNLSIEKAKIQPLWMGVQVPADAQGVYTGVVTLKARNGGTQKINVELTVKGAPIANNGDDEGWRKSRLNWVDSRVGEGTQPTAPYVSIKREGDKLTYLGGDLELSASGLPARITTHYDQANQLDKAVQNPVLSKEMVLVIETESGQEQLVPKKTTYLSEEDGRVKWQTELSSSNFNVTITGAFNFDGFTTYDMQVRSKRAVAVKDIRLDVPYTQQASRYMMGLGRKGGFRPDSVINWKWNVEKFNQDKIWMGGVNAGLNFVFMSDNYVRPLGNIYYEFDRLRLPTSWGNDEKGGINMTPQTDGVLLQAYSGARRMEKSQTLSYQFNMLITPVKPVDLKSLCTERFYHPGGDLSTHYVEEAKEYGADWITIHHKKDILPFINYPFYDPALPNLKKFVNKAHAEHLKVRTYYTVRELTVKIPELWALRSFGTEIIHDGPGEHTQTIVHNKPHEWLNKNLKTNFIPAWFCDFTEGPFKGDMDLSVITTPDSRWNNFYLSGLNWMVKNVGIDGIYIDDSSLDRITMQRARRILDTDGKRRLVDLHSWNHMCGWAGYANSIHLYLELLPYIDRTWVGELFNPNYGADFWLVEMSGIPFGLLNESLDAYNAFRGMVYGMLPRLPWSGNPRPMWKLWDQFGMQNATMLGYWDSRNPATIASDKAKSTVYLQDGKAMIVIANWTDQDQTVDLQLDIQKFGFTPKRIYQPDIQDIQPAIDSLDLAQPLLLRAHRGAILLVE